MRELRTPRTGCALCEQYLAGPSSTRARFRNKEIMSENTTTGSETENGEGKELSMASGMLALGVEWMGRRTIHGSREYARVDA